MVSTDNTRLHAVYDDTTTFRHRDCGCIERADGQRLTYCRRDNPRRGTHGHAGAR